MTRTQKSFKMFGQYDPTTITVELEQDGKATLVYLNDKLVGTIYKVTTTTDRPIKAFGGKIVQRSAPYAAWMNNKNGFTARSLTAVLRDVVRYEV